MPVSTFAGGEVFRGGVSLGRISRLLRGGAEIVFQAAYFDGTFHGLADFVVRTPADEHGPLRYEPAGLTFVKNRIGCPERARRENKTLLYEEPEGVIIVYADRNRLRQVFINILDNAIKYSDGGDTVAVTLTTISGSAVISVADTGIGIAPEELPRVKDRFYKGKSSRRGSGIGLAVADEIINMHGGSLKLTSRKGEGTTVTITLPLARG